MSSNSNNSQLAGSVYLVGAGPGDPKLITVRGAELLRAATAVVYDYLANPRLLAHCSSACETHYVGKKASSHTMTQAEINQLLVDLARQGKTVVRLKGGDPYVFGRGGEEAEALHAAGIAFEVVPGITAAIAAPAYAGIPVTHRDLNSSFTFITGHEKEAEYKDAEALTRSPAAGSSDIDWSAIARLPAIAFYMGAKSLPRICAKLIANGIDPTTPAATIQWGTHPKQRTVVGTVATISDVVTAAKIGAPAITLIGRVVAMRDKLNWFERRPLFGKTIVVTRTRDQASDLTEQLERLGANVLEAPTIVVAPPADWSAVDAAFDACAQGDYDWLTFTSANGVAVARERLFATGRDARVFNGLKIAAIGAATAAAVERDLCRRVDLCPADFVAEALAEQFASAGAIAGQRHLLLRADIGRATLIDRLRAGGAALVDDVPVYHTRRAGGLPAAVTEAIEAGTVDWITFTSSSTASHFAALLGPAYRDQLARVRRASIGPITSTTLQSLGIPATIEASVHTIPGLVDALVRHQASLS